MRLSILMMFAFTLQVSASALAQRVRLDVKNQPLKYVLQELRKQTGYAFIYNENEISNAKLVTIQLKDEALSDALSIIFKNQPFTYVIDERIINILSKPKNELPINHITEVQQRIIQGQVTDSLGNPLQGVTVEVVGSNHRVATDKDGQYQIQVTGADVILSFRLMGYEIQTVPVNQPQIDITLRFVYSSIKEVDVNAGYYKVSDKLRTGNITRVSGETIQQQPVIDPMLGLSGRVAGLQVTQQSGFPGAYHAMRIRGNNSLANGNDPLFLIDGVPFTSIEMTDRTIGNTAARLSPFAMINPEEIESIEVLKDADATAIYGSRGANGVILITTKKGKTGQTEFNLNVNTGLGRVTRMMDLLNTEQYLEMRREAFRNDGITEYPSWAYDVNGTWDEDRYTDWQDFFIGNTARQHNVQGRISGGSDQTQFTLGGGYSKESTVFPGVSYSKSGSGNITLSHKSTDQKFEVSVSARYLNRFTNQPQINFSMRDIFLSPNAPALYDEQGNYNWENETWDNPMALAEKRAKIDSKNLITNGSLSYRIIPGLQGQVNFGYNYLTSDQSNINPITSFRPSWSGFTDVRSHSKADNDMSTWIIEPQLNYSKKDGLGNLNATVGATFLQTDQYTLVQFTNYYTDDALLENLMAAGNVVISNNAQTKYRYGAIFGRLNYNWKEKYLVNLVARRDGSSRFATGRKYGNFGSVGAAWIFSNENFFKNTPLSFGKVRASYGITGNDQIGDYQYLSTYSSYPYPYLGAAGLFPTRLYSAEYGWESVRKMEAAIDLGFWKERVKLSVVAYRNRTGNQLVGYSLPTMTGFPSIQANLPAVLQNSGIEIEINTINITNRHFSWNTSFNISIPQNKLIDFPDIEKSTYRNSYEIGQSTSMQKLYKWKGVDPETGIHIFEDVNNDGQITSPQDILPLVNTASQYYGGFLNSLSYKGFKLDIFFQFVKKDAQLPLVMAGGLVNQPEWVMDRWQQRGDNTRIGKYTQTGVSRTELRRAFDSDYGYVDASFIRLKNLSLSYQLPSNAIKFLSIKQCRFYIQTQNLFTITGYPGMDPETVRGLPPVMMASAGINVTL